ncbi:LOW QUALITY PROTEIN: Hypothetical protein PHPALM_6225 [Phytophthora palmivora]|uniref:Uncharacterized protein n=1 Tax=Phytophthora palmivora TaxID=4796 RepID=A0A2P4YFE8_9STRA|nr:LOW QUALITY PROTEIN: Hypothetical protein PHPALM_6225 [Phytophthora palmivora]
MPCRPKSRLGTRHTGYKDKKNQRDGLTKIYYKGFEFTRRKQSGVKVTYTCSFYRMPTKCPGALYYYVDTMAFDYDNMIPHTRRSPHTFDPPRTAETFACRSLHSEMKSYVDKLSESDYYYTGGKHGSMAKGVGISAQVEAPNRCTLKGSQLGFLQFNYT